MKEFIASLLIGITSFFGVQSDNLGAVVYPPSAQFAANPQNGYILSTDGTSNSWILNIGSGGGGGIFATTTYGLAYQNSWKVLHGATATSSDARLEVNGLFYTDYASSTAMSATTFIGALTGNADTATALAANGTNCTAGSYALGVDASGAAEGCTDATTEISSAISTHAATANAHQDIVTLAGEDYLSLATQQITANAINADNLSASDFGDFTCNGTTCSLDATYLTDITGSPLDELSNVAALTESNGDILYYNTGSWNALSAGSDGQVLKLASGLPSWGTDNSGGGGGSGLWATTTDNLVVYPVDTTDVVVVGGNATTSAWSDEKMNINGNLLVTGTTTTGAIVVTNTINSTSSIVASTNNALEIKEPTGDGFYWDFNTAGDVIWRALGSVADFVLETGTNFKLGAVQWNSGDNIDGEVIANDTIDEDSIDFGTGAGQVGLADFGVDSNVITWTGTPSSANLATAVTGETGSGALMFGTSPTITTSFTFDGVTVTGLSGIDTTILTGTATNGECAQFDSNGDLVGAGAACGSGGGSGSLSTSTDQIGIGPVAEFAYVLTDFTIGGSSSTTSEFQFDKDGAQFIISSTTAAAGSITVDGAKIIDSTSGSATLDFIDVLGSTAEATFEAAIDTLNNLTNVIIATALEIPNGANPTVDADGEIAVDTTTDQFITYDGAEVDVLFREIPRSPGRIGSTSLDYSLSSFDAGTSTWSAGESAASSTVKSLRASTDTGTCLVRVGDGTNWTETVTASASGAQDVSLSNNTFIDYEEVLVQIGSCASSPNYVVPTLMWAETRN